MKNKILSPVILVLSLFYFFVANAKVQSFDQGAFLKSQMAGKKIVLQFHADWCPTCKKQKISLAQIASDKKYELVDFFEANYDEESELKKKMAVKGQSTIIYFKGSSEAGRSQGQTDKEKLMSELDSYSLK